MTHELDGALDRIEGLVYILLSEIREKGSSNKAEYHARKALRDIQAIRDAVPEDLKNAMDDHCYYGQIKAYEAEYYEAAQVLHAITQEASDE